MPITRITAIRWLTALALLLEAACRTAGSSPPPSIVKAPVVVSSPPAPIPTPSSGPDTPPKPTGWGRKIDRLIGDRRVSVAVRTETSLVYDHLAAIRRAPASNEKLLLSLTALSELGPEHRIPTDASVIAGTFHHGVVRGDLWIVGHGDPEFDGAAATALAAKVRAAGVRRITGSVRGDTGGFGRDRHAPGWHPMALENVGVPTALSFDHNISPSGFVMIPELPAARAVRVALRRDGVRVAGPARADSVSGSLRPIASVHSGALAAILHRQNITSNNTDAETLCKVLGSRFVGEGSIAGGASVILHWLHDQNVAAKIFDCSGLSYRNRIAPLDLTRLLGAALRRPWGKYLRSSLPAPGVGTLANRLIGVPVRAKTGTLSQGISALSGYLRLSGGRMATFSILSAGLSKDDAVRIEDAIVRTLAGSL